MEQMISGTYEQPINFAACSFDTPGVDPQAIDDDFIMQELFSIRSLEHQVKRALANSRGKADESLYLQVAELNSRVARFDQMLDLCQPAKPKPVAKSLRSRAS